MVCKEYCMGYYRAVVYHLLQAMQQAYIPFTKFSKRRRKLQISCFKRIDNAINQIIRQVDALSDGLL